MLTCFTFVFQFLETIKRKIIPILIIFISFSTCAYFYMKGYIPDKKILVVKTLATPVLFTVLRRHVNYGVLYSKVYAMEV